VCPLKKSSSSTDKLLLPQAQNPGSPLKDPVMVYYKFKNEEKAGRHSSSAGNVRVYQKDRRRHLSSPVKTALTTRRKMRPSTFTSETLST